MVELRDVGRRLNEKVINDSKKNLYCFLKEFWQCVPGNGQLSENFHIEYICRRFQEYGERIQKRKEKLGDAYINVPPGSTKSSIASVFFPVWLWINDPSITIITGSFSLTIAKQLAGKSRDLIRSDRFQEFFGHIVEIRRDSDSKTRYKTTAGGERIVTSSGSAVTGEHAHVIIIDDPIDPQGVKSEAVLTTVNDWMTKTLPSRVKDKEVAPTMVIMQRLHENDPTGAALKRAREEGEKIEHICLPATDDYPITPSFLKDQYQEGHLDLKRMGPAALKALKTKLGSIEFAGQFGQQPRLLEGNIVTEKMLPIIKYEKLPPAVWDLPRDFTIDTSDKDGQENDPTGLLSYVEYRGYMFVFDFLKVKSLFSRRIEIIKQFVLKNQGNALSRVYIEPKSSGLAVTQFLREHTTINAIEWKAIPGGKGERLQTCTPFLEATRVILVEGPWNEEFIYDVTTFPNAQDKEAVDVLVMAIVNTFMSSKGGYQMSK